MAFVRCDTQNLTFASGVGAANAVTTTFDTQGLTIALFYVWWHDGAGHTDLDSDPTIEGDATTSMGAVFEQGNVRIRSYYKVAPDSAASATLSVDPSNSSGNASFAGVTMIGFDDTIDATPVDGFVTTGGTDTTAESTVSSATGDIPVYFVCARAGFAPTGIAPTNYTEREDHINGVGMVGCGEGTGAASVAFVGTLSAGAISEWATIGININVAAGGGGGAVGPGSYYSYYKRMVLGVEG